MQDQTHQTPKQAAEAIWQDTLAYYSPAPQPAPVAQDGAHASYYRNGQAA